MSLILPLYPDVTLKLDDAGSGGGKLSVGSHRTETNFKSGNVPKQ